MSIGVALRKRICYGVQVKSAPEKGVTPGQTVRRNGNYTTCRVLIFITLEAGKGNRIVKGTRLFSEQL
jgi:hypothetical protein